MMAFEGMGAAEDNDFDDAGPPTSTAAQLQEGAPTNKFDGEGSPGKEFNGNHDLPFDSIAQPKHPPHGEPGNPGSGWTFDKYRD